MPERPTSLPISRSGQGEASIRRARVFFGQRIHPDRDLLEFASQMLDRAHLSHPEATENMPLQPFGVFGALFSGRSAPRPSGEAHDIQDQEAAAEMLTNLVGTLQAHDQHSPAILQHALISLGKVGTAAEHLALATPFLEPRWERAVRLAAVAAIGDLGGEAAIDALIGWLNDSDISVRWEVQAVLDRLLSAPAEAAPTPQTDDALSRSADDDSV